MASDIPGPGPGPADGAGTVLVLNSGSSSVRFVLLEPGSGERIAADG